MCGWGWSDTDAINKEEEGDFIGAVHLCPPPSSQASPSILKTLWTLPWADPPALLCHLEPLIHLPTPFLTPLGLDLHTS